MSELTPLEEAIARQREQDPEGWAPASDEDIGKLAVTQFMALGIAVDRVGRALRDSMPTPIRRWFS